MISGEKGLSFVSMRLTLLKSVRPCAFSVMIFIGNVYG